jgi:hypothetical protein
MRILRRPVFAGATLLLILLAVGCQQLLNLLISVPADASGAMVVSHGKYLYRIGGEAEGGAASDKTYVTLIPDGSDAELVWTETTPLPSGRAYGAAFAVGNLMFVVGGSDGTNPTSTIYFTSISVSDGTLGFSGTPRFWEKNPSELPYALSHASHVLHDGRIFLIGGKKATGASDAIIHARVWQKGQIGMWYASQRHLGSARHSTAAALWYDRNESFTPYLVVAGGIDKYGDVLDEVAAFEIGKSGYLHPDSGLARLPQKLALPVLVSDVDHILLAGGFDASFQPSSKAYAGDSPFGSLALLPDSVSAEGPSSGRGMGNIWYLAHSTGGVREIASWHFDDCKPQPPIVAPGSGIVQSKTSVSIRSEAGTTVWYSTVPGAWMEHTSANPMGKIEQDSAIAFKAVDESGRESPVIARDYAVRSLGFLVHIAGSLSIDAAPDKAQPEFTTLYLADDVYDSESTGKAKVWVKLQLFEHASIAVRWKDASSYAPASDSPYTGVLRLSLFEEDLLAESIDLQGQPILNLPASSGQPIEATLQAGTYYFLFEDAEGLSGRSFGLSISQSK